MQPPTLGDQGGPHSWLAPPCPWPYPKPSARSWSWQLVGTHIPLHPPHPPEHRAQISPGLFWGRMLQGFAVLDTQDTWALLHLCLPSARETSLPLNRPRFPRGAGGGPTTAGTPWPEHHRPGWWDTGDGAAGRTLWSPQGLLQPDTLCQWKLFLGPPTRPTGASTPAQAQPSPARAPARCPGALQTRRPIPSHPKTP